MDTLKVTAIISLLALYFFIAYHVLLVQ